MDPITIEIDAELANEYIRQYRLFTPHLAAELLDENRILQDFVHDRLREETEFIAKENA